jgi:hypothetical protein
MNVISDCSLVLGHVDPVPLVPAPMNRPPLLFSHALLVSLM